MFAQTIQSLQQVARKKAAGAGGDTISGHASLTTGLVSYWECDETSGNLIDSHGSNDMTVSGATQSSTGVTGDGVNDYCTAGDASNLDFGTSDFTIAFKINKTAHGSTNDYFCAKWDGSGVGWWIVEDVNTQAVRVVINDGTTQSNTSQSSRTLLSTSTDYYVVVTMDRSGNGSLYINGTKDEDFSISGSSGSMSNTDAFTILGRDTGAQAVNGKMSRVGAWTKVLSAQEITDVTNGGDGLPYS